jgi:nucleoside-diphosphate-sugar epimerase
VNAIVHCAAIPFETNPRHEVVATNVMGTFLLLDAAARGQVEQFLYISSIHWFGIEEHDIPLQMPAFLPIDENHPSFAVNAYGCSKVMAEFWCAWYSRKFGRSAVAIRPPLIISGDQQPTLMDVGPALEAKLYDYVGVDDLVEAVTRALDYRPPNGFDRFVVHAQDQLSATPTLELMERFFPGIPADHAKLTRDGEFGALFDCSRARDLLGWQPNFRCKRQGDISI